MQKWIDEGDLTDRFKGIYMKKRHLILAVLLAMSMSLTACGSKEGDNTQAGFQAMEQLDYNTALTCFETAITEEEDLQLAYRGLGIAYMGLAQYEDAITAFETALSHGGIFAGDVEEDINFYIASAYYRNGQLDEAIKIMDTLVKVDSKNADASFLRGALALEQENHDKAIRLFDNAIDCAKDDKQMKIDVYEVLAQYGYEEEAREYLTDMLDDKKNLSDYEQGMVYFYLQDYDNARNHLEVAKQNDNKNLDKIIPMLGKTYEALGDANYAGVLYQEYLTKHDDNAEVYNLLGLTKMQSGEYDEALAAFEKGIAVGNPGIMQDLKFNQIVACEKKGDFATAKQLMNAYMAAYPSDAEAQKEADFLSTR